jgi:hypothetical protein
MAKLYSPNFIRVRKSWMHASHLAEILIPDVNLSKPLRHVLANRRI